MLLIAIALQAAVVDTIVPIDLSPSELAEYGPMPPPPQAPQSNCHFSDSGIFSIPICDMSEGVTSPVYERVPMSGPEHASSDMTLKSVQYLGDYKGLRFTIFKSTAFYYIRSDHLTHLAGGIASVPNYNVFGPFPSKFVARVRKGSTYHFILACGAELRYIQIPVDSTNDGQEASASCP